MTRKIDDWEKHQRDLKQTADEKKKFAEREERLAASRQRRVLRERKYSAERRKNMKGEAKAEYMRRQAEYLRKYRAKKKAEGNDVDQKSNDVKRLSAIARRAAIPADCICPGCRRERPLNNQWVVRDGIVLCRICWRKTKMKEKEGAK